MLNRFLAAALKPEVGMGVTRLGWTDRDPYTVVEILNDKEIVVQADKATRTDTNGMSEVQKYTFSPDPNGRKVTLTLRKDGRWIAKGEKSGRHATGWRIGERMKYYDHSF